MNAKAMPHQRLPRLLLATAAVVVLLLWLIYLADRMPAVSRGDFLLAIMRVSADFEQGNWLAAISWPLHILGGHIVFYERMLQLANYYVFGYSARFVELAALMTWGLLGVGLWRLVQREPLTLAGRAVVLLLLALLSFNPIAWETLAWPDSVVPYLSALVALLFVAPSIVELLNRDGMRGHAGRLGLLGALVIIGSGVGWAIIPAVLLVGALSAHRQGRRVPLLPIAAIAAVGLMAATIMIVYFPGLLRLGLVTDSLDGLQRNWAGFVGYFFSLFGTAVGVTAWPANIGAGAAVAAVSGLVWVLHKRREVRVTEPELLFVFGVGSVLLVTLGRWKLNLDRGSVANYYHLFALPAFYGAILMMARLLPERFAGRIGLIASGLLTLALMPAWLRSDLQFRQQAQAYREMVRTVPHWRMTEATRLIGSPFHNDDIFFEYLPRLKASGRYPELSQAFTAYRSERMAAPVATVNGSACSDRYPNLVTLWQGADVRAIYSMEQPPPRAYYRFVGAARNPHNCEDNAIKVSLVDADGLVQCRSATSANVYWHFQAPGHEAIVRSSYAFDFSCPLAAGTHYLVSQDRTGRVLESIMVQP